MRTTPVHALLPLLLAGLHTGCLAHQVHDTRSSLADSVGQLHQDPTGGVEALVEKTGHKPIPPQGGLHVGDLVMQNGAKFLAGEDCFGRVPVEHSMVALPSYTSADRSSWSVTARELSGKVGSIEAVGGARLLVSARLTGVGAEQVALGSLVPTPECLAALERAGSPLRIVSSLLVAEGMDVGTEAGRGADVHGILRPVVAKLEGGGNRVAETTYGYSVTGHVAIGMRTNAVEFTRGTR